MSGIDVGVIVAAVIMWKLNTQFRFYADPAASLVISFIIAAGAIPLSELLFQVPARTR
jgi:zinc transporter 1